MDRYEWTVWFEHSTMTMWNHPTTLRQKVEAPEINTAIELACQRPGMQDESEGGVWSIIQVERGKPVEGTPPQNESKGVSEV